MDVPGPQRLNQTSESRTAEAAADTQRTPGGPLSDQELRFIFEASPLLMGAVELLPGGDLRHLYDNAASNRFFGLPPGSTSGKSARDLGVPEDAIALWRAHYEASARRGHPVGFDYVHAPWPGGERVLAVTVAPLPGGRGERFSYVAENVTERRRTEADLKRQETRLEMALDAARMGDWSWDASTNMVTLSPRAATIFGMSSGAHLTWDELAAFIEPEDQPAALEAARRAESGEAYEVGYRLRRPSDSQLVWVGVRGRALFDDRGRMIARLGMVWDQTRLMTAEHQLRSALESTTDSIFVLSPDWRFTFLNRRAVAQIAEGRDLLGQVVWEAFPEAVGGPLWTAYQRCMTERVETQADQFYEPLGRHFQARAFPTEAGGITVFFRDVTDELAAAARLAEVEGTLRTLGAASPDLLFAKDRQGRMLYCNPACLAVIGRSEAEVIGRVDSEWMPDPAEAELLVRHDQEIMAAGVSRTVEEPVTDARRGEVRIWQSIKTPLRDPRTGEVTGLVGVSRDITDQRRAEQELESRIAAAIAEREVAISRLIQAEKLTALGQLAGGIAHDVNNVMQAVLSASALIQRRATDADAVARLAGMIAEAAQRGASLTRKLLAFARRGELRVERVEAGPLLESLQEVLAHTLGSGVAIVLEVEPGLPPLLADRGQLEAALINLATNGSDAMPDGGRLTLRAERWAIAEADAGSEAGALAPGDYVCFAVEDTGVGIDPDVLPRVLEPFFTTKPQDKGTGLGLPMARSFAEQSGGALTLDSALGRGTCVRLLLPTGAAQSSADVAGRAPGPARVAGRVLIVDDEYLVREVLAEQLQDAGFAVTQAEDGTTALALLRSGEAYDVLVSDRSMPGMDGLALIRQARALRPGLPALLLTGFAGEADEVAAGEFPVLRKPVTATALADRIAGLIAPRRD